MKAKLLCVMLLILTVSMSVAKDIVPEKRIYLLDLSGSMVGQGSVKTDNVLEKMKSDLKATVDWTFLPTDFVFIPFTDRLLPEFYGVDTIKQELITKISSIGIEVGNTDIASAWECALGKLDSAKVNYIFLLSDGYHNRGISKTGLNSLLKSWPQSAGRCDAEAYFVLLSPKYRTSEIAGIFDETDRMSIVETMNICRQNFDVEKTEQQSDNTIAVVSDDTDKSCSLLWLWILIAIVLIALIIWTIVYWWPQISATFARMIPMSKPVSGQSPKPGTVQKRNNDPGKNKEPEDKWVKIPLEPTKSSRYSVKDLFLDFYRFVKIDMSRLENNAPDGIMNTIEYYYNKKRKLIRAESVNPFYKNTSIIFDLFRRTAYCKGGCTVSDAHKNEFINGFERQIPNMRYFVDDCFVYYTDKYGRTSKGIGDIVKSKSNLLLSRSSRGKEFSEVVLARNGKKSIDEGGHIIAFKYNGLNDSINIFPQDGTLNTGKWKSEVENIDPLWMEVTLKYKGTSKRPYLIIVRLKMQDGQIKQKRFYNTPTGKKE